eukprot:6488708-Amphidinium_carterae.1
MKPSPSLEDAPPITLSEVYHSLNSMHSGKAAGPDLILPEFLHHLGDAGRQLLQYLFNSFLRFDRVPSTLRSAIVVPIPKPGKPHTCPEDFRPISLTSSVGKAFEGILAKRLQFYLEGHPDFNPALLPQCQGGFRPGRSPSDQVGLLAQKVYDAFNTSSGRPPLKHRSVLLSLDFSKAFDRVWKTGLYHKMLNLGLPVWLVSAIKSTLCDRRAQVRVDSAFSAPRILREGLPQGTRLGPVLFAIYMTDFAECLPDGVEPLLFADDVALISSGPVLEDCSLRIQEALDAIEVWAKRWHMVLERSKCSVSVFSLHNGENCGKIQPHVYFSSTASTFEFSIDDLTQPALHALGLHSDCLSRPVLHCPQFAYHGLAIAKINGKKVRPSTWQRHIRLGHNIVEMCRPVNFLEHPIYLGVKFDSTLSFRPHVLDVCRRVSRRTGLISRLSGVSWGADTHLLRRTFSAYNHGSMTYSLDVIWPFIATGLQQRLEAKLNQVLRFITGAASNCPTISLLYEIGVYPLAVTASTRLARTVCADDHIPLHACLSLPVNNNLRWTKTGSAGGIPRTCLRDEFIAQKASLFPFASMPPPPPPWSSIDHLHLHWKHCLGMKGCTPTVKKAMFDEFVATMPSPTLSVWTDGALQPPFAGGFGYAIFDSLGAFVADGTGALTCRSSFLAELGGLQAACQFLSCTKDSLDFNIVHIYTDSLSLLRSLSSRLPPPRSLSGLWCSLVTTLSRCSQLHLIYVPGHSGVAGNELADRLASAGLPLPAKDSRFSMDESRCLLRLHSQQQWQNSSTSTSHIKEYLQYGSFGGYRNLQDLDLYGRIMEGTHLKHICANNAKFFVPSTMLCSIVLYFQGNALSTSVALPVPAPPWSSCTAVRL